MMAQREVPQLLTEGQRSNEDWFAIVSYLARSLSGHLQGGVEILQLKIVDQEAFSCSIRCSAPFGGPLDLTWDGVLGMDVIEGRPHVSASLFLFSQSRRLSASGQRGSYLELVFEPEEGPTGRWRSLGWVEDEFGEYDDIEGPSRDR